MKARKLVPFGVLLIGGIALAASGYTATGSTGVRSDCPGMITCPLTGEVICKDHCPLDAAEATHRGGASTDGGASDVADCCRENSP